MKEIETIAGRLEEQLWVIAVRPEAASRMFPPLRTLDQIQSSLKPGQTAIIYTLTKRRSFAVLLSAGKKYESWSVKVPARTRRMIGELLQTIGNYDKNQVLPASLLTDDAWKERARAVYAAVGQGLTPKVFESTEELIIVPDGFLWYLPFELLPAGRLRDAKTMIEVAKIRYVPTASLIVDDVRDPPKGGGHGDRHWTTVQPRE